METIGIELTRLFVKVVQHGSYSKAAEILRVPKSTVSKAITRLEKETGTKLLLRTTRSQTLTDAGRAFYETCLEPIQVLEDAQKSLFGQDSIVSGRIKLTAPEDIGSHVIAPIIGELSYKNPRLSFELLYTNEVVDLVKDGFDLAVRFGELSESSLRARHIGEVHLVAVAAKSYLEKKEKITSPADLVRHDCLTLTGKSVSQGWVLRKKKDTLTVHIRPKVECNQMTSLLHIAAAGAGVALVPHFLCRHQLNQGGLVRVLQDWHGVGVPVSLLSPVSIASSARLKLVSEQLFFGVQKSLRD